MIKMVRKCRLKMFLPEKMLMEPRLLKNIIPVMQEKLEILITQMLL